MNRQIARHAVRYPLDWWWEMGDGTRYRVRVLWLTVTVWRTTGLPYELRRALRQSRRESST